MKIKIGVFIGIFLLSIILSSIISLSVPLQADELGALKNIYLPVFTGIAGIVLFLIILVLFKKRAFNIAVLCFFVCLNLLTGIILNVSFKPFLSYRYVNTPVKKHGLNLYQARADLAPAEDNQISFQNMDGFPNDDHLVLSTVFLTQKDISTLNAEHSLPNFNHNRVTVRITNKKPDDLIITKASFSDEGIWEISHINNIPVNKSAFPLTIKPGTYTDITIGFNGERINKRITTAWWKALLKIQYNMVGIGKFLRYQLPVAATTLQINGALTFYANDSREPLKTLYLNSLWQYRSESDWEPDLQKQLTILGFKTNLNFRNFDNGIKGEHVISSSDELACGYFKIADPAVPIQIKKLASYHGCCLTEDADDLTFFYKGEETFKTLLTYSGQSGQTLLPEPKDFSAELCDFKPQKTFGFKIGSSYSDRTKNYRNKIGIRVWKAVKANGQIIPHAFIIGSDYLGTKGTNYDYQDNVYYITNVVTAN